MRRLAYSSVDLAGLCRIATGHIRRKPRKTHAHRGRVPILHVEDPDAERRFYQALGLRTTYEGSEYPGFIAVGNDAVEFGLNHRPGADPAESGLTWQLGVSDADAAITACERAGLRFEVIVERPRDDWTYRVVKVRSPNGMEVFLEEQASP